MQTPDTTSVCTSSVRSTKQELLTFIKLIFRRLWCADGVNACYVNTGETTVCVLLTVFFNHDEHEDVVAEETKRGHKIDLC